jgi:uncharacterized protein YeaO (DUF488 family)
MPISVQKSIYDPKSKEDGFRILVMQYWPRGVRKQEIDAWYKDLGTSKELIKKWKSGKLTWTQFKAGYLASLKDEKKNSLVHELAMRSRKEKITLLCGCRDLDRCHRAILKEQIEKLQ